MAEMLHFVRQLQAYSHLEGIECSWKTLVDFLDKKEGDLDALIDAHRSYLDRISKKILLLSPKAGKEVSSHISFEILEANRNQSGNALGSYQRTIFSSSAVPRSYGAVCFLTQLVEVDSPLVRTIFITIACQNLHDVTKRLTMPGLSPLLLLDNFCYSNPFKGVVTGRGRREKKDLSDEPAAMLGRLKEYGASFSERAQIIVQHLQAHSDFDCRFLGVRLSFSEFYKSKKDHISRA